MTKEELQRRQLFCCCYAQLGDVREAALAAGYPRERAGAEGAGLLRQGKYQKMVREFREALYQDRGALVQCGLHRLAFGQNHDAIQLLLQDVPVSSEALAQMDLYGVASIKRDKNGGMEIHFFDRLKALMALQAQQDRSSSTAESLLAAFAAGAGADDRTECGDGV